jgi:peptidoglycan hydrolase-like protein with peptidoglycan-binding domain
MSGADVRAWQVFLQSTSFDPGGIDGEFGSRTDRATRDYQRLHGLNDDGVVGAHTQATARSEGFVEPSESADLVIVRTVAGVPLFMLAGGHAVFFTARMHIDADGCPQAYGPDNRGIEDNRHAQRRDGSFSPDVIVLENGHPVVQRLQDPAPGFFISQTALSDPTREDRDPLKYVNALTVPYVVLPGGEAGGARAGGCRLGHRATNRAAGEGYRRGYRPTG